MQNTAPTLWVVIATGAATGLLSGNVGYVLLGLPLVKVKTRHVFHRDATGPRVESFVAVTNTRGRPVKIEHVWILGRRAKTLPRSHRSSEPGRAYPYRREPRVRLSRLLDLPRNRPQPGS